MWSSVLWITCAAVFGVHQVDSIAHGHEAPVIPWQAAIYKKGHGNFPICGGTLVGEDLVISSAACFSDGDGSKDDVKDFIIILGKRKSNKTVTEDTAQERQVKEVILSERFKGNVLSSSSNIALVHLSSKVSINDAVKTINLNLNQDDLDLEGKQGQIAGWGLTEAGRQSEELRVVNLPYMNFSTCYDSVPNIFRPKLTYDKICAGTLDGAFVCTGDFGSGWTVTGSDGQQYLRAVLSDAQTWASFKGQCKEGVAALTSIAAHRDWLRSHLSESHSSSLSSAAMLNIELFLLTVLGIMCNLP
ncbi:serine protease 1 [Anabrus simplex]|uniref:serine protease 1 n=1 Tax=Anabrus simplex TaxID=316456 RepID=UPI0035A37361